MISIRGCVCSSVSLSQANSMRLNTRREDDLASRAFVIFVEDVVAALFVLYDFVFFRFATTERNATSFARPSLFRRAIEVHVVLKRRDGARRGRRSN